MMKKFVFWTVAASAALLAACGQQEGADNFSANNVMELPPANMAAPIDTGNVTESGNMSAVEEATPAAEAPTEDRAQPAPKAAPTPTTRPTPRERPAARPAPKQEPAPPPTSTCTPEHEAMGHCKQ